MPMDLNAEVRRIIALLKSDFTLPDGTLSIMRTGASLAPQHMFADLGDVVPFLLYFGERDFARQQIDRLREVMRDGLLISQFPMWRIRGLVKSYEYTDLIYGLIDYCRATDDDACWRELEQTVDTMSSIFGYDPRQRIRSVRFPRMHGNLPVVDTRDGMMIELFLDLYAQTKKEIYKERALHIYTELTSLPFYVKHGIFPTWSLARPFYALHALLGGKFATGKIPKNNTNTLYGLLALYRATKRTDVAQHIAHTISKIENDATVDGAGIALEFVSGKAPTVANLTASFAMLDFLCDAYMALKDPAHLAFGERIARFWLERQSAETGLFPRRTDTTDTFVDSETDMIVALHKLHELTGKDEYLAAADRCLAGILRYHAPHDYPLSVNATTGAMTNHEQKTKFLSLFLKIPILKVEYANGNRIYKDDRLFDLLKDR